MVQVPRGCFFMGSGLYANEQPVSEVCFYEPFWIDRFEVSNVQFNQFRGIVPSSDTVLNRPLGDISWTEARDYCRLRGARLPTEAEWEYAARGPENRIYPWGNEFPSAESAAQHLVSSQYVEQKEPLEIGEAHRLLGMSWVGAYDMSGNVAEWVSSHAMPYPYIPIDGREDHTGERESAVQHVLRGGAWDNDQTALRAASRIGYLPSLSTPDFGVRCARSQR
jgi:iron(II)-dependent oxidoreductase